MKAKVTRINKRNTKSNGEPLISAKYGNPYWNIGIMIDGSDDWYSCFANKTTDPVYGMEEGQTYSITVSETVKDGKTFKNFKLLTPEESELEDLRAFKAAQMKSETFEPSSEKEAETEEVDLDKF